MNFYVQEKLREFEKERLADQLYVEPRRPRRRLLVGGIAGLAGRMLRRAGEGLEGWAQAPCLEDGQRLGNRAPSNRQM